MQNSRVRPEWQFHLHLQQLLSPQPAPTLAGSVSCVPEFGNIRATPNWKRFRQPTWNAFHGNPLRRIFPEFYGEFGEKCFLHHGGKCCEGEDATSIFKVLCEGFLIFQRKFTTSPWKDLFTFVLTFCSFNNDFLFIFRKHTVCLRNSEININYP